MYRIHSVSGDQWTIVDDRDDVVFAGTKQRCEDWLDFQENARPQPSTAGSSATGTWLSRQLEAWARPTVVAPTASHPATAAADRGMIPGVGGGASGQNR